MASTRFATEGLQDTDGMLALSLEDIPRYLFRVTHPESQGTTTLTQVSSAAYDLGNCHMADLYRIQPSETAADILNDHLWEVSMVDPNANRPTRNLVSWTSSLLFALQYTLYKHHRSNKTYDLGNIYILMVDTRQFQKGTFARDVQAIDFFCRFSKTSNGKNLKLLSHWRNGNDYYNGEYLSQGKLTIDPSKACRVSMMDLRSSGLGQICPELMNAEFWDKWARRVRDLRRNMSPVRDLEVPKVVTVAQAFDPFQVPIVIMLFSMSPHSHDLEDSEERYSTFLIDHYPRGEVERVTLEDFPATDRLPEMGRCNNLMARLVARLSASEVVPSAEASPRLVETSEGPAEEPRHTANSPDSFDNGVNSLTGALSELGISPSSQG